MQTRLTTQSIIGHWHTWALFVSFFVVRGLSFFLVGHLAIQAILAFTIAMIMVVVYFKQPVYAWFMVMAELFIGGSGHYIEFLGLSLRTVLVVTFLLLWILHHASLNRLPQLLHIDKKIFIPLFLFSVYLFFAVFNGLLRGHGPIPVIQDITAFAFLALLFPFYQMTHLERVRHDLVRLLFVYVFGTALFVLAVYLLFSFGVFELQDPFYKWFRDVNMGKITDMGMGFFRVVEPSHLLAVPTILLLSSMLMKDEQHHIMWRFLLAAASLVLLINFSRIYILAFIVGFIVLKYKHSWKRWFSVGAWTAGILLVLFISLSVIGSRGHSIGLELLGLRASSIAQPVSDVSAATRLMILPEALSLIGTHPILGIGPGATVTFYNEFIFQRVTTHQFDWGYLEMLVEFGVIGTLLFLWLVVTIGVSLLNHIRSITDFHDFHVGLLAGLVAFMIMNITSPALFHVYGILFLVFLASIGIQEIKLFDQFVTLLYRIFNRLK